jgi:hypothetical protein
MTKVEIIQRGAHVWPTGVVRRAGGDLEPLPAQNADAYGYAKRLLEVFVAENFPPNPNWKPLPDLLGVLTQIDNASTIARDLRAQNAELVAERDAAREHGGQARLREKAAEDKRIHDTDALRAENFALAANQCDDGYGDEWGNHRCRAIDRAVSECEFLAKRATDLVEALKEARGWVQDEVDADPRHRGADVLARIDTALAAALKDAP